VRTSCAPVTLFPAAGYKKLHMVDPHNLQRFIEAQTPVYA